MRPPVPLSRWFVFWVIALAGAGFDLASKRAIFERVGEPGSPAVSLIPDVLELRTSHNKGALWGFGKNFEYSAQVFAGLSIVAALGIVYWLFVKRAAVDAWLTAALALIMAGALGNCYDRLTLGYVRDFVYFHIDPLHFEFAIFNFADNMLVAGAILLMLLAIRPEKNEADHVAPAPKLETELMA